MRWEWNWLKQRLNYAKVFEGSRHFVQDRKVIDEKTTVFLVMIWKWWYYLTAINHVPRLFTSLTPGGELWKGLLSKMPSPSGAAGEQDLWDLPKSKSRCFNNKRVGNGCGSNWKLLYIYICIIYYTYSNLKIASHRGWTSINGISMAWNMGLWGMDKSWHVIVRIVAGDRHRQQMPTKKIINDSIGWYRMIFLKPGNGEILHDWSFLRKDHRKKNDGFGHCHVWFQSVSVRFWLELELD